MGEMNSVSVTGTSFSNYLYCVELHLHIYDEDFHALSKDMSRILWSNFSTCIFVS